jgi:tripartite-type tricarboxylate transporter receptor subunit TctC
MRIAVSLLACALFLTASFASRPARTETYPSRVVTVIVPFPAGGASDVVARIVAQHMSQTLGEQLVIENVGGAGGTIGSGRVAAAHPDG